MSGSGTIRTSPTGPIPATGCSWSSMDMAIIATVCPMPLAMRSRSRPVPDALPRMIPPWSAYRKRTRRICSWLVRPTTVSIAPSVMAHG